MRLTDAAINGQRWNKSLPKIVKLSCESFNKIRHMDTSGKNDPLLARNLNAVCRVLVSALRRRPLFGYGGPDPLTYPDVEDFIPAVLYSVAVQAQWINSHELEESALDDGRGDLLGNDYIVEKEFKTWFLAHVADKLKEATEIAEQNLPAQQEYAAKRWAEWLAAPTPNAGRSNLAKSKIDEFRAKTKKFHTLEAIAEEAQRRRSPNDQTRVTRVSVSRIYNRKGCVGPAIRQLVANVISDEVQCTKDDLL